MILWSERNFVSFLAGVILIVQLILIVGIYKEELNSNIEIQNILNLSNQRINQLTEIVSSGPSNRIGILKRESISSMLKLSSKATYCSMKADLYVGLRFSIGDNISLWESGLKFEKLNLKSVPNKIGTVFIFGNSVYITVKSNLKDHLDSFHRIDHLLMDQSSHLSGFKLDGQWFSRDNCKKVIAI